MSKRLRVLPIIGLCGVALIAGLAIAFSGTGFSPPGPLIEDVHFREYEVRTYRRDDETILEKVCDHLPWRLSDFANQLIGRQEYSGAEILKH